LQTHLAQTGDVKASYLLTNRKINTACVASEENGLNMPYLLRKNGAGGSRRSMKQIEEMLKQPEKFEFPAPKTLDDELYLKFIRFKQQQN
jgi:hypothetical protein